MEINTALYARHIKLRMLLIVFDSISGNIKRVFIHFSLAVKSSHELIMFNYKNVIPDFDSVLLPIYVWNDNIRIVN